MNGIVRFLRRPVAGTFVVVLIGCVAAVLLVLFTGYDPIRTFSTLAYGVFGNPKYFTNVIIKATPILLTGVAVSFAFKTGLFNIGAEGQYIFGTIVATIVGVTINLPAVLQIPLVVLSGALAGALLGAFIGFLKARLGIHEVITSIMTNWIMLYLCNFIVSTDAFHNPNSNSALPIHPSGYTMILPQWKVSDEGIAYLLQHPWLRDVLLKTDLNVGFIVAVLVAVGAGILLNRTKLGYKLRAVGLNKDAARFSGIPVEKNIVLCMLISGAFCGLAGALNITGTNPHTLTTLVAQEGYGFNGLSVAFIAGCSTVGCIPASLLFSGLMYGGMTVQQVVGVPSEIINIMIGIIVFFTAIPNIAPRIADVIERRRDRGDKEKQAIAGEEA